MLVSVSSTPSRASIATPIIPVLMSLAIGSKPLFARSFATCLDRPCSLLSAASSATPPHLLAADIYHTATAFYACPPSRLKTRHNEQEPCRTQINTQLRLSSAVSVVPLSSAEDHLVVAAQKNATAQDMLSLALPINTFTLSFVPGAS